MSVLLPSSTEPAVAKRSRSDGRSAKRRKTSAAASASSAAATEAPPFIALCPSCADIRSEVSLALAILHRRLGDPVVRSRLTALGDLGRSDLGDDGGEGCRIRLHRAGAAHVA